MSKAGYQINGNDLFDTYKITVVRTKGQFDLPERKTPYFQEWEDEDGEDAFTDADDLFYKTKIIRLYCIMEATNMSNLRSQMAALKAVLKTSGTISLTLPMLASALTVYYYKSTPTEHVSTWDANPVQLRFTMMFREPTPT